MMPTVERENIGLLTDKLTVKIKKEDYLPSFEKKLKEYSKTANIPGFRKGMVPAGMIKKMYGAGIFNDEILKTVEKQLNAYLNEKKPDIFAQPLPLENDMGKMDQNNPSDYDFGFEIGLKPSFQIPDLATAKLTRYQVTVSDDMLKDEVERMLIKSGELKDRDAIDSEENALNLLFTESDKEGNIVEGGISKENSVLLKYFSHAVQQELRGKNSTGYVVVRLNDAFEGDKLEMILQDLGFEKDDKEAADKYFKLDIIKIGLVEKREMNEDFFDEVFPGKNINTEAAFRNELKDELTSYWNAQSRNQLQDQLYHLLLEQTKMEFPEAFLKRWLQNGGGKTKTAEEAENDFPGFSNQLKWTLITDKLVKENNVNVSEDEMKNSMRAEVMRYFGQVKMDQDVSWMDSYVDRMMNDDKQADATYRRLITEKLFNWLESQIHPVEEITTPEALNAMKHNHIH